MTYQFAKRTFDFFFALVLLVLLLPLFAFISLLIFLTSGRPVFYISERMLTFERSFRLIKFRTMTVVVSDAGVSGANKASRITPVGAFLRSYRLDELPQLLNILAGQMSFVGPRPPLRQYVERFPSLYRSVLVSKPGVTGLASLMFHKHEERLLSACLTQDDTDMVYCRRCIPRKAVLDIIYNRNRSICFDIVIILRTVKKVLGNGGR